MEEADKKYAEEFLAIVQHMHITIKRTLEAGNRASAMQLLEQCQSYAIRLGQRIESTEGEKFSLVILLEDYCEIIYQIYEKIRCFLPVDANDMHNRLAMQLIRIRNNMKNN